MSVWSDVGVVGCRVIGCHPWGDRIDPRVVLRVSRPQDGPRGVSQGGGSWPQDGPRGVSQGVDPGLRMVPGVSQGSIRGPDH